MRIGPLEMTIIFCIAAPAVALGIILFAVVRHGKKAGR